MTAKQKQSRSLFKKAISEAKKLRSKNKSLTQAKALKQAFAIVYNKKRSGSVAGPKKKKAMPGKNKSGAKHTDTRSHNVNIRVVSGVYKKKRGGAVGMPGYQDPDMARELQLYADNDSQLYYQRRKPILINLGKKHKKGTYNIDKAAKLWRYYIDAALQKYNAEHGSRGDKWFELMSVPDRNLLAMEYAVETKNEFDLGNYTD